MLKKLIAVFLAIGAFTFSGFSLAIDTEDTSSNCGTDILVELLDEHGE